MARGGRGAALVEALLYIRVSDAEQEKEGLSLPAQLAACRRYAAERGWAIAGEYRDVLRGTRDDRPAYQALLADARRLSQSGVRAEGREVVVVVAWLHRFGRRVLERVRCREEFKALGVALHSAREGGEVSDLVANILASVAEEEVRQLGERVSEVIRHAQANGWHHGGRVPWGYRLRLATPEERGQGAPKAVLGVDPLTAPYAVEAWERYAAGASLYAVMRWVATLADAARGGRVLGERALRLMLYAAVYVGRHGHGGTRRHLADRAAVLDRPRGRWPALIEDDLWLRVQARLARNRRVPPQASGRYLLTGFLRCPRCGARMSGAKRAGARPRYLCTAHLLGVRAPDSDCGFSCSVEQVDAAVLAQVVNVTDPFASLDPRILDALRRTWRELREPPAAAGTAQQLKRLEGEAGRARTRLEAAALKLVDGELEKDAYDAVVDRIRRDQATTEARLRELRELDGRRAPTLPPIEEVLAEVGRPGGTLAEWPVAEQRDALAWLVQRVEPVRLAYNRYTARVVWTDVGNAVRIAADAAVGRVAD